MWEISMIALKNGNYVRYEVKRRFPEYYQTETKFFNKKLDAIKQFNEWLVRSSD